MFVIGAVAAAVAVIVGVTFGLLARDPAAGPTPVTKTPSLSPPAATTPSPEPTPPESTPPAPPAAEPKEYPALQYEQLPAEIGVWARRPPKAEGTGGAYGRLEGNKITGLIMVDSAGPTMESATVWLDDAAEGPVPGTVCGREVELLTSCYLMTESLGVLSAFTADAGDTIPDLAMVLEAVAAANP